MFGLNNPYVTTTEKKIPRNRAWCWTLNNPSEQEIQNLKNVIELGERKNCTYITWGKEHYGFVHTEGTPHLQGFAYFNNVHSLTSFKTAMGNHRIHGEIARGTNEEAILYCHKGDQSHEEWKELKSSGPNFGKNADIYEQGKRPKTPKDKGDLGKDIWEQVRKLAKRGDFEAIPARIAITQVRNLEHIHQRALNEIPLVETNAKMLWLWGPTGTGKSRRARSLFPHAYLKGCNKWWDGYEGQKVVLIEDFDRKHDVLCHHLKLWADRYPFNGEYKGGMRVYRPELVIVTSNWSIDQIWYEPQDRDPLQRRFQEYFFGKDGGPISMNIPQHLIEEQQDLVVKTQEKIEAEIEEIQKEQEDEWDTQSSTSQAQDMGMNGNFTDEEKLAYQYGKDLGCFSSDDEDGESLTENFMEEEEEEI